MIAPEVLRIQRRMVAVLHAEVLPPTGRKPKCECGSCRLCKKRQWMRAFRAGTPRLVMKRGRHMDPGRRCSRCGGPIAVKNRTGFCGGCHHAHAPRRVGAVAIKRWHYSHGGGI